MEKDKGIKETDKKKLRNKVNQFLAVHPIAEMSAARLEYSMYLSGGFSDEQLKQYAGSSPDPEEDARIRKGIEDAQTPEEMIRYMRKQLRLENRLLFRDKMMQQEEELAEPIKKRCMTNLQDYFIENALYFFLHAKKNYSGWVLENLRNFRSFYLQDMFCLIIGFRGELKDMDAMMEEADYLARNRQGNEKLDQGPILAVAELAERFLGEGEN